MESSWTDRFVERLAGLAPGDIEAIGKANARNAFRRSNRDNLSPVDLGYFARAIQRATIHLYAVPTAILLSKVYGSILLLTAPFVLFACFLKSG